MNDDEQANRTLQVAREISRYIEKRPNAAETVEGITKWWIARQRIDEPTDIVEQALEYLVNQNALVKRELGKQTLYMKASA